MFSPSKDKIDNFYASLQTYFNIQDYGELNKYLGMDLERSPYVSIHIRQAYLTQVIIDLIPGMDNSSANPTPVVNPLLEKRGISTEKTTLITGR